MVSITGNDSIDEKVSQWLRRSLQCQDIVVKTWPLSNRDSNRFSVIDIWYWYIKSYLSRNYLLRKTFWRNSITKKYFCFLSFSFLFLFFVFFSKFFVCLFFLDFCLICFFLNIICFVFVFFPHIKPLLKHPG